MAGFLDIFNVTDSGGARVSRYRLDFAGAIYNNTDSWVWGMFASLPYMAAKTMLVIANNLLGIVLSSASFLNSLSDLYTKITAPFFSIVPPWLIGCITFGYLGFRLWSNHAKAGRATSLSGFKANDVNERDRLAAAFVILALVVFLTNNPFLLLTTLLETANSLAIDSSNAVIGGSANDTVSAGQALADQTMRDPTIALTYSGEFTDACKNAWSQAQASGTELTPESGCFNKGDNDAGPDTLLSAILLNPFPAIPMLAFAGVAIWKYAAHLTTSAMCTIALPWVAAVSLHKRRGFERLAAVGAAALSHMFMVMVVSMLTVALPALVANAVQSLVTELVGSSEYASVRTWLSLVSLGIGFAASTGALYFITRRTSILTRLLKADVNDTLNKTLGIDTGRFSWKNLRSRGFNPFAKDGYNAGSNAEKWLAANPEADTSSAGDTAGVPASKSKKDSAVSAPVEENEAVTQLMKPAVTEAETATSTVAPPIVTLAEAPLTTPTSIPATRLWQSVYAGSIGARNDNRNQASNTVFNVDVYGYYTAPSAYAPASSAVGAPAHAEDDIIDADFVDIVPEDPRPLPTAERYALPPAPDPAAPAVPEPTIGDAPSATGALLGSESTAGGRHAAAAPPAANVAGNVFADPALNEAAAAVGASFVSGAHGPIRGGLCRSPLRVFDISSSSAVDETPTPYAVPEVAIGPGIVFSATTTGAASAGSQPAGDDTGEGVDGPGNDQRNWNRRNLRPAATSSSSSADERAAGPAASPSGLEPGVNEHPAGFHAPMEDELASDQLAADLEEVALTFAAAGAPTQLHISPDDLRIGVRLTSDPDHRVERRGPIGFGDPY
ncbi:Uncharacterised protein (plasmid) [Tsukamurella tyrosinosolvens]|uniref:Uncharacterized protein n=1 Tax=Tsukamurella tyrosinosolvens TaxID=57704 RepID=A0A1H4VT34_TSUTY|nr:hypothetical protein [Tsukamurella tyrosinosolvens]KXO90614.1 hypothetical protein AXK58_22860 [Tsukamurella tyrosinosolvens]SEC84249.1 hypothetical protein SAMN04489793_3331 [Tsukamurella tyrosinosolvens]VEH90307.1 Uncharacterised protein [Tsukamurella tyrosinosolvens]